MPFILPRPPAVLWPPAIFSTSFRATDTGATGAGWTVDHAQTRPPGVQTAPNNFSVISGNPGGAGQVIQDGVKDGSSSVCVSGAYTIIEAAASRTGNGRGVRYRRGNGHNNCSAGPKIDWAGLGYNLSAFYLRYYMRIEAGMEFALSGGAPAFQKDIYINANVGNILVIGYQGSGWGFNVAGASNHFGALTWSGLFGGNQADGQWHMFEVHCDQNTGVGQMKVDGTMIVDETGITDWTGASWNHCLIGENASDVVSAPDSAVDFSDFVIGTVDWFGPMNEARGY